MQSLTVSDKAFNMERNFFSNTIPAREGHRMLLTRVMDKMPMESSSQRSVVKVKDSVALPR